MVNGALDNLEELALSDELPVIYLQRVFPCQIDGTYTNFKSDKV